MTNVTTKKQPVLTLRDGSLKASVWGNRKEERVFYSVELVRSYKDAEGNWHDTSSLSNGELLRAARLLERAYDRVLELRMADKSAEVTR